MVVCEVDLRRRNVGELKIEGWEVDEPTWGEGAGDNGGGCLTSETFIRFMME